MENKINILRGILIILLICIFNLIFGFSSQDGETSSGLSRKITEIVVQNVRLVQNLESSQKEKVFEKIEHIIRKLAHFSLYTLVGILLMSLMSTYKIDRFKRIGICLIIGILYAISDEIHQFFTPDRTPLIGDVLIDSSGVAVGIAIVIIIIKFYRFIRKLKKD